MYNLQIIEERILPLLKSQGLSKNKFLSIVGLNKSIFDNMKKGQIPSVDKIHTIADYLGCSVDYLLGRTDVVEVNRGVRIIVDDGKTITPYMAAYDGSTPDNAKMSLKTIKQLDDEN